MFKPVSIFENPLLLDMICSMLDPKDIRNCASCNKKWYSFFGPHRFQSVSITSSRPDKNTFLLNSSHLIRGLSIGLTNFDTFVDANCERLRNLTLRFTYEQDEESDCDEPDDMELDEADPPGTSDTSTPRINKPACAAKLIQGSPSLRDLHLSFGGTYYCPNPRPITMPILEAMYSHTFLSKVKVTFGITCRMLGNILNHLPQQLQELDVASLQSVRNHDHCDRLIRQFSSCTPEFRIRRLLLPYRSPCLVERMLIHLLKRCPKLEELRLPISDGAPATQDTMDGIIQVLNSNCNHLHTLNQVSFSNAERIGIVLKGFSKGFRQMDLSGMSMSANRGYDYGEVNQQVERGLLEALLTTASVNTIEVLRYSLRDDDDDNVIRILKQCPQLRVLRVEDQRHNKNGGVDLSDLLLSMDESWKCWDTLEELQLKIVNKMAVQERSRLTPRRRRTAQDVRELCLRLRTLPRLTKPAIEWKLQTTWGRGSELGLKLEDLNESAVKSGSATMTIEDAAWAGLRLG